MFAGKCYKNEAIWTTRTLNDIKIRLQERDWEDVDWMNLARDRERHMDLCCEHSNEISSSVECVEFDKLKTC